MVCGYALLSPYERGGSGFVLGLLLGPLGLIIAAVMRGNAKAAIEERRHKEELAAIAGGSPVDGAVLHPTRECPYCAETILAKAKVCKHCGRDVEPIATEPSAAGPKSPKQHAAPTAPGVSPVDKTVTVLARVIAVGLILLLLAIYLFDEKRPTTPEATTSPAQSTSQ